MVDLDDLLKVLEPYALKHIARDSSNTYFDIKDGEVIYRRETTAEHIYSSLRLADYFLSTEPEFATLNRLHAYELLLYHDDTEALTEDTGISDRAGQERKKQDEARALPLLAQRYPKALKGKLVTLIDEYDANRTPEARFAHAIDKMDALVHELQYPNDWGPKRFSEANVREWFGPSFEHSPTFKESFEAIIDYLDREGYFKTEQPTVERRSVEDITS